MPNTPRLSLPYPALTDSANVPRDMEALAVKIDPGLPVDVVAAAPGTPYTGQLYFNTATQTLMVYDGTTWKPATPPKPGLPVLGTLSTVLAADLALTTPGDLPFAAVVAETQGTGITPLGTTSYQINAPGSIRFTGILELQANAPNAPFYSDIQIRHWRAGAVIGQTQLNGVVPAGATPAGVLVLPLSFQAGAIPGDTIAIAYAAQQLSALAAGQASRFSAMLVGA